MTQEDSPPRTAFACRAATIPIACLLALALLAACSAFQQSSVEAVRRGDLRLGETREADVLEAWGPPDYEELKTIRLPPDESDVIHSHTGIWYGQDIGYSRLFAPPGGARAGRSMEVRVAHYQGRNAAVYFADGRLLGFHRIRAGQEIQLQVETALPEKSEESEQP